MSLSTTDLIRVFLWLGLDQAEVVYWPLPYICQWTLRFRLGTSKSGLGNVPFSASTEDGWMA